MNKTMFLYEANLKLILLPNSVFHCFFRQCGSVSKEVQSNSEEKLKIVFLGKMSTMNFMKDFLSLRFSSLLNPLYFPGAINVLTSWRLLLRDEIFEFSLWFSEKRLHLVSGVFHRFPTGMPYSFISTDQCLYGCEISHVPKELVGHVLLHLILFH